MFEEDLDEEHYEDKSPRWYEEGFKPPVHLWAQHFLLPEPKRNPLFTNIFRVQLAVVKVHFPFLNKTQQLGKTYQKLGIPNICGELSKKFLKEYGNKRKFKSIKRIKETARAKSSNIRYSSSSSNNSVGNHSKQINVKIKRNLFNSIKDDWKSEKLYNELSEHSDLLLFKAYTSRPRKTHPTENLWSIGKKCSKNDSINKKLLDQFKIFEDVLDKNNASVITYDKNQSNNLNDIDKENSLPCENIVEHSVKTGGKKLQGNIKNYSNKNVKSSFRLKNNTLKKKVQFSDVNMFHYPPVYDDKSFSSCNEEVDDGFGEEIEDKNETANENPVSVENYDISDSLIEETSLKARNTFTVVAEVHNNGANDSVKCGIDCNNLINIHKNILPKHSYSNKYIDFDSIQEVHEKGYHSDFEDASTLSILSDCDDIENNDLGCAVDDVNKGTSKNKNNYDEITVIRDNFKNGSDVSRFDDCSNNELASRNNNSVNSRIKSQDRLEKFDKNEMYNRCYEENDSASHIIDGVSKKISGMTSHQQDSFENIDSLRDNNDCVLDKNILHINKEISDELSCTDVSVIVDNETTNFNQKYEVKNYSEQNLLVRNIDESNCDEVISQPLTIINNTVKDTILVPKQTDLKKDMAEKTFNKTFPISSPVVGKLDSNKENTHEHSKNKKADLNKLNNDFVNISNPESNDENDGLDNTFDLSYSSDTLISQSRMFNCHNSESDYSGIQFTNDNQTHELSKHQKLEPNKFFDKETEQTDINKNNNKEAQESNISLSLLEESLYESALLDDKYENNCQFSFENDNIASPTQLKNQEYNEFKENDALCHEKEVLTFETGSTEKVENISEQNSSTSLKEVIESIIRISSLNKNHDIKLKKKSKNRIELSCDDFTDDKFINKATIPDKDSDIMETSQIFYNSLITNLPEQYELNKNSTNLPYFDKTKFSDDSMDSIDTKSDNSEVILLSSQLSNKNLSAQSSCNITSQSSAYKQLKNIPPLLDNVVNDSCNKTTVDSIAVKNAVDTDLQSVFPLYRRTPFDSPTAYFVSIDDLRKEYFENYLTSKKKSSQNERNTKSLDSCAMEQCLAADLTSPTQKMYRSSESSTSNKTQTINVTDANEISDSKDSTINSDEILPSSQVIYSKQVKNSKITDDENHTVNVSSENCSSTIVTAKKISVTTKLFITKGNYEYKKEKFVEKDDEKLLGKENIRKSNKQNKMKGIKISESECSKKSLHRKKIIDVQNKKGKSSQRMEKHCSRLSVNENNTGKLSQHNKIFEVHTKEEKENIQLTENENEDKLSQNKITSVVHDEEEQLSQKSKKNVARLSQNLKKYEKSSKHCDILDFQNKKQVLSQKKVKEVIKLSTNNYKKSSQSSISNKNNSKSTLDDNTSGRFINSDSSNSSVDIFTENGENENIKTINEAEIELSEEPVVNRIALSKATALSIEDSNNVTTILEKCLEEDNFDNYSISRSCNLGNESMIIDENNILSNIHDDDNNNNMDNYEWNKSSSFNDNRNKEKNYVWLNEAESEPSYKKKSVVCKKSTSIKESAFSLLDIVTDSCHVNKQSIVETITSDDNDCDKTSNDELNNIIWMNEAIIDQTTKNNVKDVLSARLAHKRTIINENDTNINNDVTIWMNEALIDPEDSSGIYVDHKNFDLSPTSGETQEKINRSLTLEYDNEIFNLNRNKGSVTLHKKEEKIDTSEMSLVPSKRKISVTDHLLFGPLSQSKKHRLNKYDSEIKINKDKKTVKIPKIKSKLKNLDMCSQSISLQKKEYDKQKIRDDTSLISEDSDEIMEETTSKYFKKTIITSPHETDTVKIQSKMINSVKSCTSTIMKINQAHLIETPSKSPVIKKNASPLKDITQNLTQNILKNKNYDKLSSISSDNIFDSPTRSATEGFEYYLKRDNRNSNKVSSVSDVNDFNYSDLDKELSDENLSKYLSGDEDNCELNIVDKNLNRVTDSIEKYNENSNILDTFELISSNDKNDEEESVTSSALSNAKRIEELKKMSSHHMSNISEKHIVDKSLNKSLDCSSKITDSCKSSESLIKLKEDDKCLKWLNENQFTKYDLFNMSQDEGSISVSDINNNYKNKIKYKRSFSNKSLPKSSTKEGSSSFKSYLNVGDEKSPRKLFSNKSMNLSISKLLKKYKLDTEADDLLKSNDMDLNTSINSNPLTILSNSIVKDKVSTSASNSLHGSSDLNVSPVSQGLAQFSSPSSHLSNNKYNCTPVNEIDITSSPINRWKIENIYNSPPEFKSDCSCD